MSDADAPQERTDFEPTITRHDPDRVEPAVETEAAEDDTDIGDTSDPRVAQPGS